MQVNPIRFNLRCATGNNFRPSYVIGLYKRPTWSCSPLRLPLFADDLSRIQNRQIGCRCHDTTRESGSPRKWEKLWQMRCSSSQRSARSSESINTNERQTEYKLHGHTLEVVNNWKYLGVNISNDLYWHTSTHVDATEVKASKTLGLLSIQWALHKLPIQSSWDQH